MLGTVPGSSRFVYRVGDDPKEPLLPVGWTLRICPLMVEAESEAKSLTIRAVSSGTASVPVGEFATSAALVLGVIQPVSVGPG